MWRAAPYKSKHRMGQLPQSVVNQAAQSVVAQAEPRVRALIAEERERVADAGNAALPFVAVAGAGFFATSFWAEKPKLKIAGYVASAAALGFGLWRGFTVLKGEPAPPPPSGEPSLPFVSDAANQMARAVVSEAMPVIRELADEERARASDALIATLPFMAIGGALTALTIFGVPKEQSSLKVAGFTASTGAYLIGAWQGLRALAA